MIGPVLAVFAHPDDESFIAAGALALAAHVMLVVATRGEKGRSHIGRDISDDELGILREKELKKAIDAIGIKKLIILDYKDGLVADNGALVEKLIGIMRDFRPSSVITFGPDGLSGHKDHIAIGSAATKAFTRYGKGELYWVARPSFVRERLADIRKGWKSTEAHYTETKVIYSDDELLRVDKKPVEAEKKNAILCHASQAPERFLTPEMENFRRYEYFYKVPKEVLKKYR